jgi:hypothetical protein
MAPRAEALDLFFLFVLAMFFVSSGKEQAKGERKSGIVGQAAGVFRV